ncbi:hypothetical protein EVAR_73494_1 [Eumeta japonica]|uniref:Uncharacterized protein n=1 Tax=Eumeta variegata TaxID=151549 RepID=A0A4C1SVV3_EUMVA|nr:hypothetical protein EVAR_73494_1 [Eumeta japonica]
MKWANYNTVLAYKIVCRDRVRPPMAVPCDTIYTNRSLTQMRIATPQPPTPAGACATRATRARRTGRLLICNAEIKMERPRRERDHRRPRRGCRSADVFITHRGRDAPASETIFNAFDDTTAPMTTGSNTDSGFEQPARPARPTAARAYGGRRRCDIALRKRGSSRADGRFTSLAPRAERRWRNRSQNVNIADNRPDGRAIRRFDVFDGVVVETVAGRGVVIVGGYQKENY